MDFDEPKKVVSKSEHGVDVPKVVVVREKEEEEEEDVVVREIDVYFNPSIDDNVKLYVLQYPWLPDVMDEVCEEVRVNPSTSEVEIDLAMDVHSRNCDSNFGSEPNMTKQTLTTRWKLTPMTDYAIGVLSGDKLHLNPVHAVAQLRPRVQSLDLSSKKRQAEATDKSVGMSKKQKIIENKGVQASTDQKPIPEQWVSLKYHGVQSDFSSRYRKGMMANLNSLCLGESSKNSETKDSSKRFDELLREKLLCQGETLFRYTDLKSHTAPDSSDEDFLKVLQEYACLVQGYWTPHTSLLNLENTRLEFARDYVLCLFNKGQTIRLSDVEYTGGFREEIKTMLIGFATKRPWSSDWIFREASDGIFLEAHPEIAKVQAKIWKDMEYKLTLKLRHLPSH